MSEPLIRVTSLPQAERDMLIQLALDHQIYLLARLEKHDAVAIAGVFADDEKKYAGNRRSPTTGHFHVQCQLAEQALENGSADVHQWYAVDPVVSENHAMSGYFYSMDKPQTVRAKDIWCKQSDVDAIRLEQNGDVPMSSSAILADTATSDEVQNKPAKWTLIEPARNRDPLTPLIFSAIKTMHSSGGPFPTIVTVTASIAASKSPDFIALDDSAIRHADASGRETTTSFALIKKRISNMAKKDRQAR